MGVTIRDRLSGAIIGPPADKLYPVEPVEHATINPSAGYICVCPPLIDKLMRAILPGSERETTISLIAGRSTRSPSGVCKVPTK